MVHDFVDFCVKIDSVATLLVTLLDVTVVWFWPFLQLITRDEKARSGRKQHFAASGGRLGRIKPNQTEERNGVVKSTHKIIKNPKTPIPNP